MSTALSQHIHLSIIRQILILLCLEYKKAIGCCMARSLSRNLRKLEKNCTKCFKHNLRWHICTFIKHCCHDNLKWHVWRSCLQLASLLGQFQRRVSFGGSKMLLIILQLHTSPFLVHCNSCLQKYSVVLTLARSHDTMHH